MGESLVDASSYEDKVHILVTSSSICKKTGGLAASDPLRVSVSFGRFENDSLSWEKWSSFSPNKYLEEVEKCATPGSVAEKKAYFEAHYRKIAARKAEILDHEKPMEHELMRGNNHQNCGDLMDHTVQTDPHFEKSIAQGNTHESQFNDERNNGGHLIEANDEAAVDVQAQASEEQDCGLVLSSKMEGVTLVKEVEAGPKEIRELPNNSEEKDTIKSDHPKESPKIIPMTKIRVAGRAKKKPEPPETKLLPNSTLKVSKPVSTLASRSSTKNFNCSLLPRSKNPSSGGNKKVAPKSLHMSLSLDPPNSEPAPPTATRKSFIMEKMGDKDIVRRAFKTFQNNFSQSKSAGEERSIGVNQIPAKGTGVKVSTSLTPRKESIGSNKAGTVDRTGTGTAKPAPSSFVLKSDERVQRRKEFAKKPEGKRNTKLADSTKAKEENAETKELSQSLNLKAIPKPGFYRGQKTSKSSLPKEEGSKTLKI